MLEEKSCGAIVYNNEGKVLIVQHNAGHWDFPKGHVENNETEVETAVREVKEETNIDYSFLIKPINPKEKWNLIITIGKNSSLITKTSFNNGNFVVDVKLSNYKLNNNFSPAVFKFTAPNNVDVIEL